MFSLEKKAIKLLSDRLHSSGQQDVTVSDAQEMLDIMSYIVGALSDIENRLSRIEDDK